MTLLRIGFAGSLAFLFIVVTQSAGLAASAQCNAELRKCNSHCNLVYESKRSNRVCRAPGLKSSGRLSLAGREKQRNPFR
jgi:hypothetical protein